MMKESTIAVVVEWVEKALVSSALVVDENGKSLADNAGRERQNPISTLCFYSLGASVLDGR